MRETPEAGGEPRAETQVWPDVQAQMEPHGGTRAEPAAVTAGQPAEPVVEVEVKKKRMDLSVPQVAGSAVAAVVAAKLASYFGVYGTIFGAGVVSVLATCGGTVFQHFFRRTGEQIREVTVVAKPRDPQRAAARQERTERAERPGPDPARALPVRRGNAQVPPAEGEFTEGTVYRARVRSWKRPLVAASVVFGVTMAGITTYEFASGDSFSGSGGTTVGNAFSGSSSSSSGSDDDTPSPSVSPEQSDGQREATPSDGATADPGASTGTAGTGSGQGSDEGGASSGTTPSPEATDGDSSDGSSTAPTPSATATTPAPSASSRSGNDGQDQDGLATP